MLKIAIDCLIESSKAFKRNDSWYVKRKQTINQKCKNVNFRVWFLQNKTCFMHLLRVLKLRMIYCNSGHRILKVTLKYLENYKFESNKKLNFENFGQKPKEEDN